MRSFSAFTGFGLSATSSSGKPHREVLPVEFQCLHRLWPLCYSAEDEAKFRTTIEFQCLHRLWPLCYDTALRVKSRRLRLTCTSFSAFTGFGLSATSQFVGQDRIKDLLKVSVPSQALASLLPSSPRTGRGSTSPRFQCLHRLWPLCYVHCDCGLREDHALHRFQCLHRLWPLCYDTGGPR